MPRIGASSRVLALLGDPVAHSVSPAMHNAAIATLGLEAVYVAFRVPVGALGRVFDTFRDLGIAGNLTVPLKPAGLEAVDVLTDTARRVGAVNTFWCDGGRLHGDNTDVGGVLDAVAALKAEGPWLLVGTGGSARAVAVAAANRRVELVVRSRADARARGFAAWAGQLGIRAVPDDGRPVNTVINATPVGLRSGDPPPVPMDRVGDAETVLDLVYAPGATAWVRACRAAGRRAADGRGMLVGQGARAFERFFPGCRAPRSVMEGVLQRVLEG